LNKQGAATLSILNTGGNNYTGPTVITAGILSVTNLANGGSASPIGASSASSANLVLSGGALSYAGPAVSINRGYTVQGTGGSAIDTVGNLTLSGLASAASSSGEFSKTGSGQLAYTGAGTNTLSGVAAGSSYRIAAGTVFLGATAGVQTNAVRNMNIGRDDGVNTALILTNTILTVEICSRWAIPTMQLPR
jgi:fibronectin-binding autotransporter adhesin